MQKQQNVKAINGGTMPDIEYMKHDKKDNKNLKRKIML